MRTDEALDDHGKNGQAAIHSRLNWERESRRIRQGLAELRPS